MQKKLFTSTSKLQQTRLFGNIPISLVDRRTVLKKMFSARQQGRGLVLNYINSECFLRAVRDDRYRHILTRSDIIYPDGYGVIIAARMTGVPLPQRVNAADFFDDFIKRVLKRKKTIYLIGGRRETIQKTVDSLRRKFSLLKIIGYTDGYLKASQRRVTAKKISQLRPDFLLVGMGVPMQEQWVDEYKEMFPHTVTWCVGGLFRILSGELRHAPSWMRKNGLEWLYRLYQEPKRLWRRYTVHIIEFCALIVWFSAQYFLKRAFDLIISTVIGICLLPAAFCIAVLIKLTSPGPIFFIQQRVGQHGRHFSMYKFRTMIEKADKIKRRFKTLNEADGPVFKIKNDPRFTPLGAFLSRSGFDEIPQLLNVVKGDMSLVGPRPLPVYEVVALSSEDRIREAVRPGMTSMWVLEGSHRLSFRKWMELDRQYVESQNFFWDAWILFHTVKLVVFMATLRLLGRSYRI